MNGARSLEELAGVCRRLEGAGYPAYRALRGDWEGGGLRVRVDHVQADPFADPSRVRLCLDARRAGLPAWALADEAARTAAADYLLRALGAALRTVAGGGSGRSGEVRLTRPGPEVLPRTALSVSRSGELEVRLQVGLPAAGRRVLGREAARLLGEQLPRAVAAGLEPAARDEAALRRQVEAVADARALRAQLEAHGLVAFVAEGAVLPRRAGDDDRPLPGAEPFLAPDGLRVTLEAPHAGPLAGMGVPRGVTLLVGGGFHGKSTLLRALERGVYDHVPGDGRERVVTLADAVKVRAEDGRAVTGLDISNFVGDLPDGQDTRGFTTRNASGSTSQAAALVEALEAGCRCLLLDEDSSASNLLVRDARMQALVPAAHEPLTPLVDRVRELAARGVSTVLVMGGSGDYLEVADTVLALEAWRPRLVTAAAREVAARHPTGRRGEAAPWRDPAPRRLRLDAIRPGRGRRARAVRVPARDRLLFGEEEVRLHGVEQLVEEGQLRAIGHALAWVRETTPGGDIALSALLDRVSERLAGEDGLLSLLERPEGDAAWFRRQELAAVLGRLRALELTEER